jgi:shikimate kinase / 3-dehydroquinate synthase
MIKLFLYGPPGSGKSAAGHILAENLALPFYDLDREIEAITQSSILEIFTTRGEAAFRAIEREELQRFLDLPDDFVLSLGAGALLDQENRRSAEASGTVVCLNAAPQVLRERLAAEAARRPLLSGDLSVRLESLLSARCAHYASFPARVDTSQLTCEETAWQSQVRAGCFRIQGMGTPYTVLVSQKEVNSLGRFLTCFGKNNPIAMVSDRNVASHYEEVLLSSLGRSGFSCHSIVLPPGESTKHLATVAHMWEAFLDAGLDRKSTVLAVGGGVVTDLAGFAAATYLRGIGWGAVPSTLLGMVDASLGGKTGIDLPRGKNLAGAFHAPGFVLVFPALLGTLPEAEVRNGMAEVIKHGIIGDAALFEECAQGRKALGPGTSSPEWGDMISRAVAVKVRILLQDPYERGSRAILNFGHTVGHALEQASGYRLRHGEAVAIGMAVEAQMGENLGLTEPGLAAVIGQALNEAGLPTLIPSWLDPAAIRRSLRVDKKNQSGKARLSLPMRIGHVQEGIEIEEEKLWTLFWSCMDPT